MSHLSLHIDADSAGDLLDTIQQLGETFLKQTVAGERPAVEQDVAPKAARTRAAAAKPEAETPAASEVVIEQPKAEEPEANALDAEQQIADNLDYDRDVAPKVLDAVKKRGKPFVLAAMDAIKPGVAKASELLPEQWSTLLDALAAPAEG